MRGRDDQIGMEVAGSFDNAFRQPLIRHMNRFADDAFALRQFQNRSGNLLSARLGVEAIVVGRPGFAGNGSFGHVSGRPAPHEN
jgi:hypothetical protein